MLPYTPLHHLLLEGVDRPIVLIENATPEQIGKIKQRLQHELDAGALGIGDQVLLSVANLAAGLAMGVF